MARSALLNIMVQAATKGGRSLTRDFNQVESLQVSRKGPGDFVSAADSRAENAIRRELESARPGYSFLMEEGGAIARKSDYRWIIDPLDGTTNFLHSIPLFAVSIALENQGELVAGVIYNPISEELFTAERGKGAYVNNRRMRMANRSRLEDCAFACGVPALSKDGHDAFVRRQKKLMTRLAAIRATGSAALNLAWLAMGRFDLYYETGLKIWDIAAGLLMVREAGGFASAIDESESIYESGCLIAGNEILHKALREILSDS